jgi:hypothetical protein
MFPFDGMVDQRRHDLGKCDRTSRNFAQPQWMTETHAPRFREF